MLGNKQATTWELSNQCTKKRECSVASIVDIIKLWSRQNLPFRGGLLWQREETA